MAYLAIYIIFLIINRVGSEKIFGGFFFCFFRLGLYLIGGVKVYRVVVNLFYLVCLLNIQIGYVRFRSSLSLPFIAAIYDSKIKLIINPNGSKLQFF